MLGKGYQSRRNQTNTGESGKTKWEGKLARGRGPCNILPTQIGNTNNTALVVYPIGSSQLTLFDLFLHFLVSFSYWPDLVIQFFSTAY